MRHDSCMCWANICQGAVLLNICREVIFLMIGQPINLPWAEFVFVTVGRGQLMTERADISCNGRPDDTKHVSDEGGWQWRWHQVTTLWSIEAVITELITALTCVSILTIGNALWSGIIHFELYGGDPKKRSITNRVRYIVYLYLELTIIAVNIILSLKVDIFGIYGYHDGSKY